MEILEERFRSRFEWGLIADITLPDYETRMAILHKKEEMDGYDINEEVIKYIANNIKSNIRELEGAINKVMAFAKLEKKEVTLELAEQALKDIISPDEKKVITPYPQKRQRNRKQYLLQKKRKKQQKVLFILMRNCRYIFFKSYL